MARPCAVPLHAPPVGRRELLRSPRRSFAASTLLAMVTYLRRLWAKPIASRRGRSWRTFAPLTSMEDSFCEHVQFGRFLQNSQIEACRRHVFANDNAVTVSTRFTLH